MPYSDEDWMRRALDLARHAESLGEVPVGAMLVRDGRLIAAGWNCPIGTCDPSAHAEIVALRRAGQAVGNYRFPGSTLYVTLEPCVMCLGAIIHARIQRLVFGAFDPERGAVCSRIPLADAELFNHRITYVGGILGENCGSLLRSFFLRKRAGDGDLGHPLQSARTSDPSPDGRCYNTPFTGEVPKRS